MATAVLLWHIGVGKMTVRLKYKKKLKQLSAQCLLQVKMNPEGVFYAGIIRQGGFFLQKLIKDAVLSAIKITFNIISIYG